MHELGMAQAILDIVKQTLEKHPGKHLKSVNVHIGEMNAVVPELLQTAFAGLVLNTPLQSSQLVIQILPVNAVCEQCGKTFTASQFIYACPFCSAASIKIIQGDEMYIKDLEVE